MLIQSTQYNNLPKDVLFYGFSFLDPKQICQMRRVCKFFFNLINDSTQLPCNRVPSSISVTARTYQHPSLKPYSPNQPSLRGGHGFTNISAEKIADNELQTAAYKGSLKGVQLLIKMKNGLDHTFTDAEIIQATKWAYDNKQTDITDLLITSFEFLRTFYPAYQPKANKEKDKPKPHQVEELKPSSVMVQSEDRVSLEIEKPTDVEKGDVSHVEEVKPSSVKVEENNATLEKNILEALILLRQNGTKLTTSSDDSQEPTLEDENSDKLSTSSEETLTLVPNSVKEVVKEKKLAKKITSKISRFFRSRI